MNGRSVRAAIATAAAALAVALAGCAEDTEPAPPAGPFADALAEIASGGADGSLGVGWADPLLVGEGGRGAGLMADALLPNAGSVIEAAPRLRERFGIDPFAADRLISVGGSYAFGLRLEGVDGTRLRESLIAAGGRSQAADGVELIDIGDYAVVPEPLLEAGVNGLGAFDAFGSELVILAISDRARASLLGEGERLLDKPIYRAAADCLGEVVVARLVPDKQLLATDLGIDLVSVGVRSDGEEVLCVVGGTAERSAEVAANLEVALGPDARDPNTGEPIGDSVAAVEVASSPYGGVPAVRAEVALAPGEQPGYLFGTLFRASAVGLINGSTRTFQ